MDRLFEYAVLLHPSEKEKAEGGRSVVILEPQRVVAKDAAEVQIVAMMKLGAGLTDQTDQIEVLVRPFA